MFVIKKLPPWVEFGGFWLTLIAGSVNAIGLLGYSRQGLSHLTGTSTLIGSTIVAGNFSVSVHLFFVIISFVLGATASGLIIGSAALKLGRRYGIVLLIEAALFYLALLFLTRGLSYGNFLASAACGLQNGMASRYSGASIRTTHVSGMFTDLGVMLGSIIKGKAIDNRRAKLYIILITGFIIGGVMGSFSFTKLNYFALYLPIFMALSLSSFYWFYWFKVYRYQTT